MFMLMVRTHTSPRHGQILTGQIIIILHLVITGAGEVIIHLIMVVGAGTVTLGDLITFTVTVAMAMVVTEIIMDTAAITDMEIITATAVTTDMVIHIMADTMVVAILPTITKTKMQKNVYATLLVPVRELMPVTVQEFRLTRVNRSEDMPL